MDISAVSHNAQALFTPQAKAVAGKAPSTGDASQKVSADETRELEKLKQRDREVRQHEQAHLAAAGQYARGGASYTYQRGPDGRNYAVGGEVQIDTSAVPGDPEATLRKMQTVQSAASAPAEPSAQDRAVAAQAAQTAAQARVEIQTESREVTTQSNSDSVTEGRARREYQATALEDPAAPALDVFA